RLFRRRRSRNGGEDSSFGIVGRNLCKISGHGLSIDEGPGPFERGTFEPATGEEYVVVGAEAENVAGSVGGELEAGAWDSRELGISLGLDEFGGPVGHVDVGNLAIFPGFLQRRLLLGFRALGILRLILADDVFLSLLHIIGKFLCVLP